MKNLLKTIFASMVGTCLAFLFLFLLLTATVAVMSTSGSAELEAELSGIQDNSILKVTFDGPLKDRSQRRDFVASLINYDEPPVTGLYELTQVLKDGANNEQIRGLYLHFKNFRSGMANAENLRREILNFKKSGKFVVAYAEVYSELAYLVASAADEVILYPKGYFEWDGLFSKSSFIKNTFNKLDVVPQVFRVGKYKSAIEPFINEKMSPESREQLEAILQGAWGNLLTHVSEKTKMDASRLNVMASNLSVVFAQQAFDNGFVTLLASEEEVEEKLMELSDATDKPRYASWKAYYKTVIKEKEPGSDNKIALVFAEGGITSEDQNGEGISSEQLAKLINKIRRNEKVKAVVLRVNSPGGSALASDVIWTATQWLKDAKPLVSSFGNVAASGGYYMSAGSQYIFAEPTSITGSIGVFGLSLATKKFWNDRVGMTFDTLKSHKYADLESLVRVYRPDELQKMQSMVDGVYEDFLSVVQKGRASFKSRDQVHQVAQGRVWLGTDALKQGLIDELGGLEQAILKAAELAKLSDYDVEVFPKELTAFEEIVKQMGGVSQALLTSLVPETLSEVLRLKTQESHQKILTRLPFDLQIK